MAAQQRPETPEDDQGIGRDEPKAADPTPHTTGSDAAALSAEAAAAVAELEDRWRRALADLDNLRKRYARELERERSAERARVVAAWLPVVDNLDRALAHATVDPNAIVEGIRAVREQALATLDRLGYPRDEEVGVPFDPARHEAVKVVDDAEAVPGTVVEVLRPGYGQGERWLRPAAVAVAAAGRG